MVIHCGCKNKGGASGRTTRGQCEFNDKKQVPLYVKSNLRDFPINLHSISHPSYLCTEMTGCRSLDHTVLFRFCLYDSQFVFPAVSGMCWYAFNCGHEWLDCSHHLKVCKRAEGNKQEGWCLSCPAEWWSQTASSYIIDVADILWLRTQHITF